MNCPGTIVAGTALVFMVEYRNCLTALVLLTDSRSACYDHSLLQDPTLNRPRRLAWPRTSPFHGGNTGSNPVGDAKSYQRFTRKLHLHRDTQKIHALSAGSYLQLCFARPACRARELGCRCPASSLTLNVATTPALLSHPHHCP